MRRPTLATRRSRLAVAGVAALVALVAVTVASATIPDSGGVIHGCYTKSGGSLRVIDASVTNCKSTETSLNWSQTGPKGPTGSMGAAGPPGPAGSAVAYGYVDHTGTTVSDAFNLSASNLTPAGASSYCFHDLQFTPHNVQVTLSPIDRDSSVVFPDTSAYAGLGTGGAFTGCPSGTQAFVNTYTPGGQLAQNGFFVSFN